MLRCADDSLYTGIATDVERRVSEHVGGSRGAKYLKGRLPVTLVFRHEVEDRSVAQRLEYRIKRLAKVDKERLIRRPGLLDQLVPSELPDAAGEVAEP